MKKIRWQIPARLKAYLCDELVNEKQNGAPPLNNCATI